MIKGTQLNTELNLGALSAKYRKTGDWYSPLTHFPGILFDINGYVLFQTEQDYSNCPQIVFRQHIHILDGISSIDNYQRYTPAQLVIVNELVCDFEAELRKKRECFLYNRNQTYVRRVKAAFDNTCAICETRIEIRNSQFYSEVHHIIPLNENGPDQINNMICVCPNCHVKLDLKVLRLDLTQIHNPNNHIMDQNYVNIHNNTVI